jgi:hypothetical protein
MNKNLRTIIAILTSLVLTLSAGSVNAGPISIMVGDADGYGFGAPDNGTGVVWPGPGPSGTNYDGRDATEKAATNGAQLTDVYSSIFPGFGPNTSTVGNVIFPLSQPITSGTLTVAMGDFQASAFGPITVSFNGVVQPGLFNFNDGFGTTVVRSFPLSATALANANAAGQFVVTLDRSGSGDFIAFDFFRLDAVAVPEPTTMALFGLGVVCLVTSQVRRRNLAG